MEKALQLVYSHQVKDGASDAALLARKVPALRTTCVETPATTTKIPLDHFSSNNSNSCVNSRNLNSAVESVPGPLLQPKTDVTCTTVATAAASSQNLRFFASPAISSPSQYNSNKALVAPPPPINTANSFLSVTHSLKDAVSPENSPSVLTTGASRRLKPQAATTTTTTAPHEVAHIDPIVPLPRPNTLLKALSECPEIVNGPIISFENAHRCSAADGNLLGVSDSSQSLDSCGDDENADGNKPLLSDSGESKEEKKAFFKAKPRRGEFTPIIDWLLRCGERGEITMPGKQTDAAAAASSSSTSDVQLNMFSEDNIMKLCTAATEVLVAEPTLLELEVLATDTLIVVGDIHGQFQDLYTSVLCQQYDHRHRNPDGADRRFLFMGDYVDRGPHSLEVVLLLLALKVEYPSLVYLTRGNHEEEKTSRVYGFLTEATSALGAKAGPAVWSAVNKVFLDLPLSALVTTPRFRFLVMHGGLSPALQTVEQIAGIDRHAYNTGELSKEAHDIVDGLLWSDPAIGLGCFAPSARGCGWNFGPATSNNFCTKNKINFICRAHQLAMDGYFWTHSDRVVTVFSAPNYCGINDNRGAVMVVSGSANKPSFDQYEFYEEEMDYGGCPSADFPYSSYFC